MNNFIIDESKFIVDMDMADEKLNRFLEGGHVFANGLEISECVESDLNYQVYITNDKRFIILACKKDLYEKWVLGGYVVKEYFEHYEWKGEDLYLLYSPSSLILQSANSVKIHTSLRYARTFASAIWNSRLKDGRCNLSDGIFIELYGVILPIFSKSRNISDYDLFKNALDINLGNNFEDSSILANLSFQKFEELLDVANIVREKITPYLTVNTFAQGFVDSYYNQDVRFTGPLLLNKHYQLFNTNTDKVFLILTSEFAKLLIDLKLISDIKLRPLYELSSEGIYGMQLSKRLLVESLSDRHAGLTTLNSFKLARAIRHTRNLVHNANLKNALYLEELGVLLPYEFDGNMADDKSFIEKIVATGPFAISPFSVDHIESCMAIVS